MKHANMEYYNANLDLAARPQLANLKYKLPWISTGFLTPVSPSLGLN